MELKRCLLLLCLFAFCKSREVPLQADSDTKDLGGKIVGGSQTDILNYPYQVSLQYYYRHRCGGAIVSNRWVLTAAHCTRTTSTGIPPIFGFTVRAGSSFVLAEGRVIGVSRIVDHPGYLNSYNRYDYDISLVQLSSPLTFTNSIQPIPLPTANQQQLPGAPCVITGWGTLTQGGSSPSRLHVTTAPWISNESCNQYYSPSNISYNMMCAGSPYGGRDACQGDSGGPLAVNGVLMGIVSWGIGCAQPGFPGVYAYVVAVRQWITDTSGL